MKKITALALALMLLLSLAVTALAVNTSISAYTASERTSKNEKYAYASISDAYWIDTHNSLQAAWDADYRSSASYTVVLYRGNTRVASKSTSRGGRIDFSEVIATKNKTGDYYFVVKAKWPGKYTDEDESDYYYVDRDMLKAMRRRLNINSASEESSSSSQASSQASAQVTNTTGPVAPVSGTSAAMADGWYRMTDGTSRYVMSGGYCVNGWYVINGKWYCFDPNGTLRTNQWIQNTADQSIWYYVGATGEMVKNQYVGQWYLNANGEYHA